jgi:hypothetical protein
MNKYLKGTFSICALLFTHLLWAQTTSNSNYKGLWYFAFGTNRSFYTHSNISLESSVAPAYNFTLDGVGATDDQGLKFNHGGAPQYSYQLGYYNRKKNWGIEFNFDHIKYFMRPDQVLHLHGTINDQSYNTDTLVTPEFLKFEHSDGANYALFKWVTWRKLASDRKDLKTLNLVLKAGAGPVIPKTNSTVMGKHRDDVYKISGYVIALEGGLRYNFTRHLFAEGDMKAAYADYSRFVVADGTGSQKWGGLHFSLLVGLQIPTGKLK